MSTTITTKKIRDLSKEACLVYIDNVNIIFTCPSSNKNNPAYGVRLNLWEGNGWSCNCKYFRMKNSKEDQPVCSHIMACIYKLTGPTPLIKMINVYNKSHPEI